ncbi:MAG TPA: hypothetical protein DCS93_34790 [Microscillaceae bacterium]|nr:hypothetical protein [Microscillaceae bacterium]
MAAYRLSIKNKGIQHVVFWVLLFLTYILAYGGGEAYYWKYIRNSVIKFPFYIIAAYTLNYWQVPQFLNKEKKAAFVLSVVLTAYLLYFFFKYFHYWQYGYALHLFDVPGFFVKTLMFYPPALLMFAYQTQQKQQQEKARLMLMQQEKLETELKYLKAQLNPHFLFNTLNNLYSFVVNQSPKAADMVLQLSEILDYALYRSQAKLVSIAEEMKCIENYIALEKIRYGERLQVILEEPSQYIDQKVAPLLLLSIVENAFKHGVNGSVSKPKVKISLDQSGGALNFKVWNTKNAHFTEALDEVYKEGIGLSNIKRQLNLIYPQKHQIYREEGADYFQIHLVITTI